MRIFAGLTPLSNPPHISPAKPQPLPAFTILLPVYHEAHMIGALLRAILATDYPHDLLEIVVICEPDDTDTIDAARKAIKSQAAPQVRLFITDGTGPKTKPNALNAAFDTVSGDIVTVYDAEDRPHPAQLRAAAKAITAHDTIGVVQAPLLYYNATDNWITKQFAIEYAALFLVWLPFLARLNLPFPLGGTSNHISGLM